MSESLIIQSDQRGNACISGQITSDFIMVAIVAMVIMVIVVMVVIVVIVVVVIMVVMVVMMVMLVVVVVVNMDGTGRGRGLDRTGQDRTDI